MTKDICTRKVDFTKKPHEGCRYLLDYKNKSNCKCMF